MASYDLNADLKAMMIVAGGGKPIAPAKLNPLRVLQERRRKRPEREPTEAESAAAWAMLGRGLGIVTIPPPKPKQEQEPAPLAPGTAGV